MAGIFEDLTSLAVQHQAVNLGQGFPDFLPPQALLSALTRVAATPDPLLHQYTRSYGHPRLVRALAQHYSGPLGRPLDPLKEVLVPLGAYGALVCAITGLVGPGDDVILIEPFFDCYQKVVRNAGATPVYVTLRPQRDAGIGSESAGVPGEVLPPAESPGSRQKGSGPGLNPSCLSSGGDGEMTKKDDPAVQRSGAPPSQRTSTRDWKLDLSELEGKVTPRTRAIVLNNPSNPLGKVFSREELEDIARVCRRHDLICISDEVYEWLVYDGAGHTKMAALPGMWERTLTIGSAGKMFSATGWKTGWVIAPDALLTAVRRVHQNCYYRPPTPIQEALGEAMEGERACPPESAYTAELARASQSKRDRLAAMLESVGLRPVVPEGGYFLLADVSPLLHHQGAQEKQAGDVTIGSPRDDVREGHLQTSAAEIADVSEEILTGEKQIERSTGDHSTSGCVTTTEPTQSDATSSLLQPDLPITASKGGNEAKVPTEAPDIRLMRRLVVERGVAAIPLSAFYSQENKVKAGCFLRFCFVKSDVTLDKAEQRFRQWADDVTPKEASV